VKEGGVHLQVLASRAMPYTIAIPLDYDPDVELPLVLALHYGGTMTDYIGGLFLEDLVGPALSGLGGIMVAPDAIHGDFSNAQAEADLLALLDAIDQNYKIAPDKTIIVGFSMGGAGVWYMAERHPGRFSAAIPVAARPPAGLAADSWTVPMFIIHSRDDEIIPYADAEAAYNALTAAGLKADMVAIDGLGHFETSYYQQPLNSVINWLVDLWSE
jgi:predicted peptidase